MSLFAEITRTHAESEFEKNRIVQDRHFENDFDKIMKKLRRETKAQQTGVA